MKNFINAILSLSKRPHSFIGNAYDAFAGIGLVSFAFFKNFSIFFITLLKVLRDIVLVKFYWSQFWKALFEISFFSLSVVFLTSLFTGAVLTLQAYIGLSFLASSDSVSRVVISTITKELGPVLTGLMIAGRVSSAIAAEISTMKNSEQIDALKMLNINPTAYLVTPRVLVGMLIMPLLFIVTIIIAMLGSYLICVYKFDISQDLYLISMINYFSIDDFTIGFQKSVTFGLIVTFIGCMYGMNSSGGSEGVGRATTNAVVTSSILILIFNYLITLINI